jgi:hypothetical protein
VAILQMPKGNGRFGVYTRERMSPCEVRDY